MQSYGLRGSINSGCPEVAISGALLIFPMQSPKKRPVEMVFLAITYEDVKKQYEITSYRNGESLGSFNMGDLRTWPAGDAEAIWGKRHDKWIRTYAR